MIRIINTKSYDENGIIMGSSRYELINMNRYLTSGVNLLTGEEYNLFIKRNIKTASEEYPSEMSYSIVNGEFTGGRCVVLGDTGVKEYEEFNKSLNNKTLVDAIELILEKPFGVTGKTEYILKKYQDEFFTSVRYLRKYNTTMDSILLSLTGETFDIQKADNSVKKYNKINRIG